MYGVNIILPRRLHDIGRRFATKLMYQVLCEMIVSTSAKWGSPIIGYVFKQPTFARILQKCLASQMVIMKTSVSDNMGCLFILFDIALRRQYWSATENVSDDFPSPPDSSSGVHKVRKI